MNSIDRNAIPIFMFAGLIRPHIFGQESVMYLSSTELSAILLLRHDTPSLILHHIDNSAKKPLLRSVDHPNKQSTGVNWRQLAINRSGI